MRTILTSAENRPTSKSWMLMCFLLVASTTLWAQQRAITGIVKNTGDSQPVANATVQVKGTKIFTVTDNRGAFSITVKSGQMLVVTVVGSNAVEKVVGMQTSINFDLSGTAGEMENVIVTALGIRREERAPGYSTTTVKGEQLTEAISSNWTDALSGKVAVHYVLVYLLATER